MATSCLYDTDRAGVESAPLAENWCSTKIKVIDYSHTWTIKNFSLYSGLVDVLHSKMFTSSEEDPLQWQLRIYPNGVDDECRDSMSVFVALVGSEEIPVQAKYTMSLLDAGKNKVMRKSANETYTFFEGLMLGFNKFVSKEFMMNPANGIVVEDTVTILCEVSVMDGYVNICGRNAAVTFEPPESPSSRSRSTLLAQLSQLLHDSRMSDVTLCVDGHELPAHKAILAAQSPVFAALFSEQDDDLESNDNRLAITNVSHEVMIELLSYVYTGRSSNVDLMARDLLAASDIYQLDHLKTLCEEALKSKLSDDTAVKILIYSDMYSALHLKACAIEYINSHDIVALMSSDEWKVLVSQHPHLLEDLYRAYVNTQGMKPCIFSPYMHTRR